ncbi:MAG: extracellular solute-binding protein [Solirubrobacterales bacterium]|nr:extracellular solute-binding protein [Solirubrobacterales bacterium]
MTPDSERAPGGDVEAPAIDPRRPIPLYFQLKTYLLQQILSGRYGNSDRLPTEHELCERFGASRTPVHRALAELAEEGVILRRRRHGTFVNPHWISRHSDRPELRVLVPEGPWQRQMRENVEEHVRINVASVALPDLHQALTRAIAEARGPDLALIDSVWVAEFTAAGFLAPIAELDAEWVAREYEPDFLEPFVAESRRGGGPVAVPAEADVAGLWYRRSALEDAGVDPPTTWDELRRAGEALRRGSGRALPLVMPGGSRAGETTTYCLLGLLASNGVAVLDGAGVTLDSGAAVEALELLRGLVEAEVMSADAVAYEWDRPIGLLARGRASMAFGGSYDAQALAAHTGSSLSGVWEEFGFTAIPAGPSGPAASLAGGMVWVIPRQASHAALAMRELARLVSPEACATMSLRTGQIPPRHSAVARVAPESPLLSVTAGMLGSAMVRPATSSYARVSAQLQTTLESVLTGALAPEAAASRGAELIAAITGLPVASRT